MIVIISSRRGGGGGGRHERLVCKPRFGRIVMILEL